MVKVEVTGPCGFVWKGEIVLPGRVLDCTEREAHLIVVSWKQGRYVGDAPAPTRPGMVVNADPVAEQRDPVVPPKRKAR